MQYHCIVTVWLLIVNRIACYEVSNLRFPSSFLFGASTSAFQIEGAWNESGKGINDWDYGTHTFPIIPDGSNADIACDSYHKYEEDIANLKELNVSFYRFSISWSRILPTGYINNINQDGVDYYNNLIDGLLEAGIKPWVTIYHFDMPLNISILGGWYNEVTVNLITEYADLLFSLYGDRVQTWLTLNEPHLACSLGLDQIPLYGGVQSTGVTEYLCGHNSIKAHAKIYRLYEWKYKAKQRGRVTFALNVQYYEPASDSEADIEATERTFQFEVGWFLHPLVFGNYPQFLIDTIANYSAVQGFPFSRLPKFTIAEIAEIRGAYDLIAINNYVSYSVSDAIPEPLQPSYSNDQGATITLLEDYPEGFRKLLVYIKNTYKNPEIVVTEQGYSDEPNTFNDTARINYFKTHLSEALKAIYEDGVRLTAYSPWSLMDNFEWLSGYSVRYGLYNVDFDSPDRTRTPKESAYFYKNVVERKCLVDTCE